MNRITFVNARIFDGVQSEYLDESVVMVEGDRIVAVERQPGSSTGTEVVDVAGRTLMPGLIDAHCHVLGSSLKVTDVETQPLTYVASYASKMLGHAIDCGFTTVRDVGGGEAGIARAVQDVPSTTSHGSCPAHPRPARKNSSSTRSSESRPPQFAIRSTAGSTRGRSRDSCRVSCRGAD